LSAQFALPLAVVQAEFARSGGDLDRAREVVERAAGADIGDEHRYKWPLLSLGARIEAERAVAESDSGSVDGQARRMVAIREEAEALPTTTAADRGHLALVRAEHTRLSRTDQAEAWSSAVSACRAMNEPFPLAYALFRHAEAASAEGALDTAAASAREAVSLVRAMGAEPLAADIEALIRRARLPVHEGPESAPAPTADDLPDELARLGLTARESEVLALVAEGCSNGQIAERLVISRKTASVHVSNILAKLGVATRVEAAAMAHRRGLIRASEV
jgi:DNA-binding NarL/FixJ family response regulator